MRTKANKARNEVRRKYPTIPDDDPAFDLLVQDRMRAQNEGAYDPDSFLQWFTRYGASDNEMERETVEEMRPKLREMVNERPGERRKSRRRQIPKAPKAPKAPTPPKIPRRAVG